MDRKQALKEKLPELQKYFSSREEIATVYLIGSFGTEHYTRLSDIDFAILFNHKMTLMEEMEVSANLSIILDREDVDLVNLNKARVDLQHEILRTGEIIFERDRFTTADFIEDTLRHYFDFGLTLKKMKDDFREQLREGL